KCGDDFIIGFRISADEFIEGGRTIEATKVIVKKLEEAGADLIHASAGVYASADTIVPPSYVKHGWIADFAAEVKKACSIPVIAVGRINDPHVADSIIESGKADFAGMARASLIDPALPNKAMEGKFEDIRHCIGCNHGCLGILFANGPIKCVLNPELGNEHKGLPEKAATPKKIAIAGAGPAGLEAAIYAALAGHAVTVFEKDSKAGGQLYLAAIPPGKGEITSFIRWQLTQAEKLGVEIKYNTEVSADFFADKQFDQIIVATGAQPAQPAIPGADLPHVVSAQSVLAGECHAGYNVVVIGGGQVGAETANHLAVYLKNITLVEMQAAIAADEPLAPRWHLLRSLDSRKVRVITNGAVEEIKPESVIVKTADGKVELPCDGVVMATGSVPNDALAKQLLEKGLPVKIIGDAGKVGNILDATEQGYNAALSI
ncbi:MAG: FAD-dependent oxidoreductase, partial [Clostridiales bacterium]|nr:FAD-dependent oxidoreductase [Clostridiales bacterium]